MSLFFIFKYLSSDRWNLNLNPDVISSPFTPEEDARILELHKEYGNQWAALARNLPGRTENSVKKRSIFYRSFVYSLENAYFPPFSFRFWSLEKKGSSDRPDKRRRRGKSKAREDDDEGNDNLGSNLEGPFFGKSTESYENNNSNNNNKADNFDSERYNFEEIEFGNKTIAIEAESNRQSTSSIHESFQ